MYTYLIVSEHLLVSTKCNDGRRLYGNGGGEILNFYYANQLYHIYTSNLIMHCDMLYCLDRFTNRLSISGRVPMDFIGFKRRK